MYVTVIYSFYLGWLTKILHPDSAKTANFLLDRWKFTFLLSLFRSLFIGLGLLYWLVLMFFNTIVGNRILVSHIQVCNWIVESELSQQMAKRNSSLYWWGRNLSETVSLLDQLGRIPVYRSAHLAQGYDYAPRYHFLWNVKTWPSKRKELRRSLIGLFASYRSNFIGLVVACCKRLSFFRCFNHLDNV